MNKDVCQKISQWTDAEQAGDGTYWLRLRRGRRLCRRSGKSVVGQLDLALRLVCWRGRRYGRCLRHLRLCLVSAEGDGRLSALLALSLRRVFVLKQTLDVVHRPLAPRRASCEGGKSGT